MRMKHSRLLLGLMMRCNSSDVGRIFDPLDMPERIKAELTINIRRKLTPQPVKIRADIDCSCFGYEGIDAVKKALLAGEACSTQDIQIKVNFFIFICLDSINCSSSLCSQYHLH
jgi:hypothetical protein